MAIGRAFPGLNDKRREITGRDGAPVDAHVQDIETMWRGLDRRPRSRS